MPSLYQGLPAKRAQRKTREHRRIRPCAWSWADACRRGALESRSCGETGGGDRRLSALACGHRRTACPRLAVVRIAARRLSGARTLHANRGERSPRAVHPLRSGDCVGGRAAHSGQLRLFRTRRCCSRRLAARGVRRVYGDRALSSRSVHPARSRSIEDACGMNRRTALIAIASSSLQSSSAARARVSLRPGRTRVRRRFAGAGRRQGAIRATRAGVCGGDERRASSNSSGTEAGISRGLRDVVSALPA